MSIQDQILKIVSNRRDHDKHSLYYMLHHCNGDHHKYIYADQWKRGDLMEAFEKELRTNEVFLNRLTKFNGFNQFADESK